MSDIAQGLGMSKKTLYTHFADKEDLLMTCLDKAFVEFFERANTIRENNINPIDAILAIYRLVVNDLCDYCSAFMYDARRLYYTSQHNSVFRKQLDEAYILPLLQSAREQQLIHSEVNDSMFCTVVYYMVEGFLFDSNLGKQSDKDLIYRHVILLPVRGILAKQYAAQYGEPV